MRLVYIHAGLSSLEQRQITMDELIDSKTLHESQQRNICRLLLWSIIDDAFASQLQGTVALSKIN